jgi:hypothetical protein
VAFTPTNYVAATPDVEAHLVAIDSNIETNYLAFHGESNVVIRVDGANIYWGSSYSDAALLAATGAQNTAIGNLNGATSLLNSATGVLNTAIGNLNGATGALNAAVGALNGASNLYVAADTVVSNGLMIAHNAQDVIVSNAYKAADTVVSNGVTTAFGLADAVVSNGVMTGANVAMNAQCTIVSNALLLPYQTYTASITDLGPNGTCSITYAHGSLVKVRPTAGSNTIWFTFDNTDYPTNGVNRVRVEYFGTCVVGFVTATISNSTAPTVSTTGWNKWFFNKSGTNGIWDGRSL